MELKKILLISDYDFTEAYFISDLKRRYEVNTIAYITSALCEIKKPEKYDLIVIEVSLPTLNLYSREETANGLKTGIVFYEKEVKQLNIPVIFWSWNDLFADEIARLDGNVIFVQKDMEKSHLLLAVMRFDGKL